MTAGAGDEQAVLIGKDEVAKLTSLSKRTLERLVSTGRFPPPIRLGRKRLWHRRKLEAWLAGGCKPGRFA